MVEFTALKGPSDDKKPLSCNFTSRQGFGWLVGWFGLNGPLRQYFSLYRAVSQREGERRERIDESKNVQTTPTRTYCKRSRPLPYCNQNCRTPRHWKFTQHHRTTRPPPQGKESLDRCAPQLQRGSIAHVHMTGWFVSCVGFNGPFWHYFSIYRAVSQRAGERRVWKREKMSKQRPPAPTASAVGPCPTI